jgi:predicted phosphoribosyltransferase
MLFRGFFRDHESFFARSVRSMSQDASISLPFADRHEAGRILASRLTGYAHQSGVTVLGLARGGVRSDLRSRRHWPCDLMCLWSESSEFRPRRTRHGSDCLRWGSSPECQGINKLSHAEKALREATAKEEQELKRRERQYREGREFRPIEGNTVIVVDDGLATGATMRAATIAIKQLSASRCVIAVPVGAPDACGFTMKQMKSSVQSCRARFTRSANSIATSLRPPMTKCELMMQAVPIPDDQQLSGYER